MGFHRIGSPELITDVLPDLAGMIDDGTEVTCPKCSAKHTISHGIIIKSSGKKHPIHGKHMVCECGEEFKWRK